MGEIKKYRLDTEFESGKYEGWSFKKVYMEDPQFVESCILNDPAFMIENSAMMLLEDLNPEHKLSERARSILLLKRQFERVSSWKSGKDVFHRIRNAKKEQLEAFIGMNELHLMQRMDSMEGEENREDEYLDDFSYIKERLTGLLDKSTDEGEEVYEDGASMSDLFIEMMACSRNHFFMKSSEKEFGDYIKQRRIN